MQKLLLPLALIVSVVAAVACSSGGGSNSVSEGSYQASNYSPGTDGCIFNFDPTVQGFGNIDFYVTGNSVTFSIPGIGQFAGTMSNGSPSVLMHNTYYNQFPNSFTGVPGPLCTEDDVYRLTSKVTGGDQMDVTFTQNFNAKVGSQCNQVTAYPLPCTSTESFHLAKVGPPSHATPTPTPVAVSGTGTLTSDRALVRDALATSPTSEGLALSFSSTIGSSTLNEVGGWSCIYDPANGFNNYEIIATNGLAYLLVSTAAFTTGRTATVDNGANVFAFLAQTNGAGGGVGLTGTLTINSAGRINDVGQGCKFSVSGMSISGFRAGP